ncbi:MAG: hypothetical protein K8H88_00085 [Sandaracinaceae bacterium]|nr:hypothetical protein [Sandaracinaceae bacterium]
MRTFVPIVTSSLLLLVAARAHAFQCGSLTTDAGDNTVILGEVYQRDNSYPPQWVPVDWANGDLGACWTDQYGLSHLTAFACGGQSSSSDFMLINTGAGDDQITVWHGQVTSCPGTNYAIGPWFTSWNGKFFVDANLGTGFDRFYGTPNRDVVDSNTSTTDDGEDDLLCGYGGNDTLTGDTADATDRECLWGGGGTDVCDGAGDSPEADRGQCEMLTSATNFPPDSCYFIGGQLVCENCWDACGTSPPNLWWGP